MCSLIHRMATQNFPAHSQSLTLADTIDIDIELAEEHMLDIIDVDIPSPPLSINIPMENHFTKIDPMPLNDMFEIDIPMETRMPLPQHHLLNHHLVAMWLLANAVTWPGIKISCHISTRCLTNARGNITLRS